MAWRKKCRPIFCVKAQHKHLVIQAVQKQSNIGCNSSAACSLRQGAQQQGAARTFTYRRHFSKGSHTSLGGIKEIHHNGLRHMEPPPKRYMTTCSPAKVIQDLAG